MTNIEPLRVQPERILIECTDTVRRGIRTGIQRAVRSLVREGVRIGRERDPAITGVVLGASGFELYSLRKDLEGDGPLPTLRQNVLFYAPQSYIAAAQWCSRWIRSRKFRSWLLPQPEHLGVFKPLMKLAELAEKLAGRQQQAARTLELGPGDLLILADACWKDLEIWEHVRRARAAGAFIATVIYDIIPLSHPQFVVSGHEAGFRQYLREAVTSSDLIVAISQTIRDQLREQLPVIFPDVESFPRVEGFSMGADFGETDQAVRKELVELFSQRTQPTPYLTVSTIEPRKNHSFTLRAMEMSWSRGANVRLMCVGKRGWMSDDLLRAIETHAEFGKRLFWYDDLSDSELFYCYRHARGTISSSFVEGFNLPIVESLWHGRKTFVSDTPIHREVGRAHVEYFGLSSSESLVRAIARWEAELALGANMEQRQIIPMSWRESTELLLEKTQAAYADARGEQFRAGEALPGEARVRTAAAA